MKLIELKDVSMRYDRRFVLDQVDLTINRGDFLAITGPNGGGKTTLLRIILKLLKPTSGQVLYNQPSGSRLRIGYLPQKNAVDSRFPISVREVVEYGLNKEDIQSGPERKCAVDRVLEEVGMSDRHESAIGELSGGQLQRVLLARAIVGSPEILIMDEPLSYVDKKFEHKIYDIIRRLSPDVTIVLVSHEMSTIASMANRHIIVDGGLHFCRSANHFVHYDCCDRH